MDRIATILCMKGDSDAQLALLAVRSTASSLTRHDMIFVGIDGGDDSMGDALRAAAGEIPLELLVFPKRIGLARGLNRLLDEVLSDEQWQLIARMDADDESLPGRMECQRCFFDAHPDVDILGTACREVDEQGRHLQDKFMPLDHATIILSLPRSNPLNHPTVMARRRLFDTGLRYRADVRRTEDYHLWIDAARCGFVFANLPQPLLNFRRDASFFSRRGGPRQAVADLHVRVRAMAELGLVSPSNVFWALSAFVMRLLPGSLQRLLYARFR